MKTVEEIMKNMDTTDRLEELFGTSERELQNFYNYAINDWKSAVTGKVTEIETAGNLISEVLMSEEFTSEQLLRMVFLVRWLRESGKQQIMKGISMIFD